MGNGVTVNIAGEYVCPSIILGEEVTLNLIGEDYIVCSFTCVLLASCRKKTFFLCSLYDGLLTNCLYLEFHL